ncbi:hypothetical protein IWC96_15530 [Brevundimonas sp. BAL450]|jgi:hypothetical protein|uniref:hypothetical protein n=1 Tax=Brevundimonas TaxID=41275 RepID=UPI0005EC8F12|nr:MULTISPECIES: hypothetical protein [Brevundimonas]MBG7616685.1 hypothetical protein [Brevundimonas sp. BAL450]
MDGPRHAFIQIVLSAFQALVRRRLENTPLRFDCVYFLSPHDAADATIFTVYPGQPHSFFTEMSDERLAVIRLLRVDSAT